MEAIDDRPKSPCEGDDVAEAWSSVDLILYSHAISESSPTNPKACNSPFRLKSSSVKPAMADGAVCELQVSVREGKASRARSWLETWISSDSEREMLQQGASSDRKASLS